MRKPFFAFDVSQRLNGSFNVALCRVWDVRKLQKLPVCQLSLLLWYPPSHSREQAQPNGILELNFQDVEKLDDEGGITTLRAEHKHDKAVTSAHWDPRGRSIASTCYDDALRSLYCMVIARVLPVLTRESCSMGHLT